jgi:hypothetical protein
MYTTFAVCALVAVLAIVAAIMLAMVLYPELDVVFDPLRLRFEVRGRRPAG